MKRYLLVALVLLTGCNAAPTRQEVTQQYYGPPIEQSAAEEQAKALMQSRLKDPYTAMWECRTPERGWIGDGKMWGNVTYYGWVLVCGINAKNSFGAYNGAQEYRFLFLNGQLMRAAIFSSQGLLPTTQVIYSR